MATALTETGTAAAVLVLAALGLFRILSINVEKACIKPATVSAPSFSSKALLTTWMSCAKPCP
jgi:hypothetical protein